MTFAKAVCSDNAHGIRKFVLRPPPWVPELPPGPPPSHRAGACCPQTRLHGTGGPHSLLRVKVLSPYSAPGPVPSPGSVSVWAPRGPEEPKF
jgi:hypothetical protein